MKWISIVLVLIICSSFLPALGQKSIPNNVPFPSGNKMYYAQLTPYDLQVIEKERYKVIKISVNIKIENLPFDDIVLFDYTDTMLKDENSKVYRIDIGECGLSHNIGDYVIDGKKSNTVDYRVCYSVDKSLEKFSILYKSRETVSNPAHTWQIGTIDLTQYSKEKTETPTSNLTPSSTSTFSTNIFEQLMNWLKQIFHFMVLGHIFS